ncbi:MAG: hypothetical protein EOM72_09715 [Opitutae bacterium]|nr:hypothetical protein [Opitutae bacterium]
MKKWCFGLCACLWAAWGSAATTYNDTTGDLDPAVGGGDGTVDIVSLEVSHTPTDLVFDLTVNGNFTGNDWGKFMVGMATGGAGTTSGNGWNRPISLDSPIGGMNYWIGAWVDEGGGAELYSYNGAAWNGPASIAAYSFTTGAQSRVTYTVSLADLGLGGGDMFYFDVYASGGAATDSAFDALSNPNVSITTWDMPYTSRTNDTGLSDYTIDAEADISPGNGPFAGGNSVLVTNAAPAIGDGGDITNVTVGGVAATGILGQGADWVEFVAPATGSAGAKDIVIQSTSVGDTTLAGAYTVNPAGLIGASTPWDWSAWETTVPMPDKYGYMGAVAYSNKLYSVAGNRDNVRTNQVFSFDGTNWVEEAPLPRALTTPGVAVYNGRLYSVGGMSPFGITNVYSYDGTDWRGEPGLPSGRGAVLSAVIGDDLYAIGGMDGGANPKTNVYRFNGTAWSEVAGLSGPDARLCGDFLGGKLHIVGGYNASTNALTYDGTNFTFVAGLPAPRKYIAAATVGGAFLAYGGTASVSPSNDTYRFDGTNWTQIANLIRPLYSHGGATYQEQVYAMGGSDNIGRSSNVYRYPAHADSHGVSPSSASWVGGTFVTISGENLGDGADVTNATLCGVAATIASQTASRVWVVAGAAAAAGTGDVRVFSTSFGETVKSNVFEYLRGAQAALTFVPASPQAYGTTNGLATSGGSGTGAVSYAVMGGPGTIVGDTNLAVTAGSGTIEIRATKAQDDLYAEASVTGTVAAIKATATVELGNLDQTYDGTPKAATATTVPEGLTVAFTYDGSETAPTAAGSYAVTGTVVDANWQGEATGTLVITLITNSLTVGSLHGTPTPGTGTTWHVQGGWIDALVDATVLSADMATQHVCVGWSGTGSVPESGTSNAVSFTITNHSTLVWNWITKYDLTINPDINGSVDLPNGWYVASTNLSITATPVDGYEFSGWTGDVVTDANPLNLTMDRAYNLTPTFTRITNSLTVDSLYGTPIPGTGTTWHFQGALIDASVDASVLSADMATQHVCVGWSGTGSVPESGTSNAVSFTITNHSTLVWNWITKYDLTINPDINGSIDLPNGWYVALTNLSITATPVDGYEFAGWTGDIVTDANPLHLIMDRAYNLTPTFKTSQSIAFAPIPPQKPSASVGLEATGGGSGQPVVFAVTDGPGTISGETNLSFTGVGDVVVVASQAGDADYAAAPDVTNVVKVFSVAPDNGPFAGGNTVTVSNGNFGTITNVLVGSAGVSPASAGSDWFTIILPAVGAAGAVDVVVQTADNGDIALAGAYTVNPAGEIWGREIIPGGQYIAGGGSHALGLKSDGTVVGWGVDDLEGEESNNEGQTTVPPPNTNFVAVAAGDQHSLGVKSDGTIVAWGRNDYDQTEVPSPNADFIRVAAGRLHSMGLKSDGTIVAWGGAINIGAANVPEPNADFVAIAAGEYHSLGVKSNGTIVAWGSDDFDQASVPEPNVDFVAVAAGVWYSLGLKSDGTIVAWGLNDSHQAEAPSPNAGFVAVAAGRDHSLGLKSDGTVVVWGDAQSMEVPEPNADFVAIAAGPYHSMGLKADGTIVTWGYDPEGLLVVPDPNENFGLWTVGVEPASGSWTGSYEVVISGANLGNGADITNVTLCGVAATVLSQAVDQVWVTAEMAGAAGLGDVRTFSTSYGETVKSNAFTYMAPGFAMEGEGLDITSGETARLETGADFAPVRVGASRTNGFWIRNPGNETLTISAYVTNGAAAEMFAVLDETGRRGGGGGMPSQLDSEGSGRFELVYAPTAAGAHSAALEFTHDGPGSPFVLNLAGMGYEVSVVSGPFAGENTITVTGSAFGTITNVLVGGASAAFTQTGPNEFTVMLPPAGVDGAVDIVVQTSENGDVALAGAYTYNPPGRIGFEGMICGWEELAGLPVATYYLGAGSFQGSVYAVGGMQYVGGWSTQSATNVYRLDGAAWTEVEGLPGAAHDLSVATFRDRMYALGGTDGIEARTNVYRFDGTTWTEVEGLPAARTKGAAAVWEDHLYYLGGGTNVYRYDGTNWTEVASLPERMEAVTANAWDGKLLAIGGMGDGSGSTAVYAYDGSGWTESVPLPVPMAYASSGVLDGGLHVWAGAYFGDGLTNVYRFDGARWQAEGALPNGRFAVGGCVHDGALHAVAGFGPDGTGAGATTNVYRSIACDVPGVDPASGSWAGGFEVVIRGADLGNGSDVTNVTLCGVAAESIVSQSATQIVVLAGAAEVGGAGDVAVQSTSHGQTVKSDVFTYLEIQMRLTVETAHGTGTPPAGIHTNRHGAVLTNSVASPDTQGTTQYVCTGWTLAGHEPADGTGTQMTMTATNDAALTWLWETNYWLATTAGPHGAVDVGSGWQAAGATTQITATADAYYRFTNWTGAAESFVNPLELTMDAAKSATAHFAAIWTTNRPTPQWWLADFDLTNDFEYAVGDDPDGDGAPTGDEFVMDTDPTQSNSCLYVSQMDFVYGSNCWDVVWTNDVEPFEVVTQQVHEIVGHQITWPCSTARVYDVEVALSLPPLAWLPLEGMTNLVPDGPFLTVTNLFDGTLKRYYRLTVRLPE